ncbi:hypothetical protein [Natrinema halophilum]|uniref:Uncharacterized protein n=1 Tax=Natrinema halophilum TaxID=1699371 RepID=A0A7D5GP95_9EURY|nr:hypothetical protein [Natrinema halophilum]QLG50193.1 hypothetical protein HYG82_15700 [Natrinema halophilum]
MSVREEFWSIVCAHSSSFYLMFVFVTVMAVLNAAAVGLGEQSAGTIVVSLLVFVILGLTGFGIAIVLWVCKRR